MKIFLCVIITLLAIILYVKILGVLNMLEKKKDHIISETKLNNIDSQQEAITLTNAYLALIIEVCRIEVSRHMASLKAINLKYDFLKLDEDVSSISEKVHQSLQKDFMIKSCSVLTSEYINNYIVDNVKTILLASVISLNRSLTNQLNE